MFQFLVSTLGTWGDVAPFIAIGQELRVRGHEVVLLTHAPFEAQVVRAGLGFRALDTLDNYESFLAHPDHWHWRKNFAMATQRMLLPSLRSVYERIGELHQAKRTILLACGTALGARIAQERLGCPLATIHLAPFTLRSVYATPRYSPIDVMPRWLGKSGIRFAYWLQDFLLIERHLAPGVNRFRAKLDLPPISRLYAWANSPERVIGLWPEWYGPAQPDWPSQTTTTGFVYYDSPDEPQGDELFSKFSEPPIIFTAGTGVMHAHAFFHAAVETCRLLSRPGILVTRYTEQLPRALPFNVIHVPYAPFDKLFPRAAAVVHHGGIGTAASALRAGIPQLIVPMAVDQFDNAHRLQRLGVARALPVLGARPRTWARQLCRLILGHAVAQRCHSFGTQIDPVQTLCKTCDLIEELGTPRVQGGTSGLPAR